MPAKPRFTVTYDEVTPSDEDGGYQEESGFVDAHHQRTPVTCVGPEAAALKAANALTLSEVVRVFGCRFGKAGLQPNFPSIYQADSETADYSTGATRRLALHLPRTVTQSSFNRVLRYLTT